MMFRTSAASALWTISFFLGWLFLPFAARADWAFAPAGESFVQSLQCKVANALADVYSVPHDTGRDRFIVLSLDRAQRYVQCRFVDDDAALSCEASSGFYGPLRRVSVSPDARAAVAAEGFVLHRGTGNFVRRFDLSTPQDFARVSATLLHTLEKAYDGARFGGVWLLASNRAYESVFDIGCLPESPLLQRSIRHVTHVRVTR